MLAIQFKSGLVDSNVYILLKWRSSSLSINYQDLDMFWSRQQSADLNLYMIMVNSWDTYNFALIYHFSELIHA